MLTFEENGWNFKAFKILSALNLLPIQVDLKTGKIRRQSSKPRIFLWRIYFSVAISHCFYMLWRLVQSTIVEPEKYFRWDHFVLHFGLTVIYSVFNVTGFHMFVKNSDECMIIFNQLFVERENPVQKMMDEEVERAVENIQEEQTVLNSGTKIESSPGQGQVQGHVKVFECDSKRIRPLFTWPPQYSLDELLSRVISVAVVMAAFLALVILAVDPSRPQLLYSSLPSDYQNVSSFLGLLSVEGVSLAVIAVSCLFSIVTELLFFAKCQAELQRLNFQLGNLVKIFQSRSDLNRDTRREIWILRQILRELRELVVFIELFNRCFPLCIFAFKILCLVLSILFYFFTIRHGADFPFLAPFTGYVALAATLIYSILFQHAFSIPEQIEQVKREFLVAAQKTGSKLTPSNPKFRAELKREVRRIPDVGVKVGTFHTLERDATPQFVDGLVKNVVNLLVLFPR